MVKFMLLQSSPVGSSQVQDFIPCPDPESCSSSQPCFNPGPGSNAEFFRPRIWFLVFGFSFGTCFWNFALDPFLEIDLALRLGGTAQILDFDRNAPLLLTSTRTVLDSVWTFGLGLRQDLESDLDI
ncbi:hypothetical protein PHYBLDRAFT_73239 [Phycomyces blakesleeanus NRRL 1555(-)]|uniref:Uncharacterized protein n=1 Tax=Phycomyces blakesleeanus (strain ATCC 8743b / DSM 1359 / FGSC 10004 / NBRC 33097 / NRRL 1555) TaxID=763407 RepID=A0A167JHE1_PHYB8|nr:hypothetical protein PHYBLDRAFT_73239 [Phycomyces blakesleeanus NRRL 1555(-)]OAD65987.1 hypothetical protein PHYBLDRAFT_73239 [Phycomyces blakesleeanus NRRL 1555(-)]|eukprot:XP_018284027.1 hypothetical protein PHYBLDRAFT_73239 [Phycomyces blakesleeanus NRRL 1555(-)]